MKRRVFLLPLAIVALLVLAASCGPASSPPPAPGPNEVNIYNYAFSPSTLTVAAGTTVTWKNYDSVAHTVESVSGAPSFLSGDLADGATYSVTFSTPGTYKYICSIHITMSGTVVVN
jgi:plastocyanin